MPSSLFDLVEAFFELLDFLLYWKFWVPILIAVAVTVFISQTVPDPVVQWVLGVPIILAGVVVGFKWDRKKD